MVWACRDGRSYKPATFATAVSAIDSAPLSAAFAKFVAELSKTVKETQIVPPPRPTIGPLTILDCDSTRPSLTLYVPYFLPI